MTRIQGVKVRDLQVNVDERGHLVEIFRNDWDEYNIDPAMSYYSMTYPDVIRAWHRHHNGQIDYFVCLNGRIKIGIYDERDNSPTKGELNTFVIGEHNQQVVRIPGDCWHGFKVVSNNPAILVNCPTKLYNYENPDEERIPYDSNKIPLDWEEPPHE